MKDLVSMEYNSQHPKRTVITQIFEGCHRNKYCTSDVYLYGRWCWVKNVRISISRHIASAISRSITTCTTEQRTNIEEQDTNIKTITGTKLTNEPKPKHCQQEQNSHILSSISSVNIKQAYKTNQFQVCLQGTKLAYSTLYTIN